MSDEPFAFDVETIALSGKNLIEASAGTGKTYAIARLFRRLVLERELEPAQILVVTFTEAATAELRERIRAELGAEPQPPRLRRARANVDEAPISTIHGFCQRVLYEQPLGSGVAFGAELTPDLEELYDDVLYDFWHRTVAVGSAELAGALERTAPDRLRQISRELRKNPRIRLVPPADGSDPVLELKHQFVRHVQKELRLRKDRRRVLGFEDLLERLAEALAGPSGEALGRTLRERFRAVLIDEFQDTDPLQNEIFGRAFGGEHPLFLIGDPKQAIYGFRGADVFSYLGATRGSRRFTMQVNWRSDPGLVGSINHVFARPDAFLVPGISYRPLAARPGVEDAAFVGAAALDLLFIRRDNDQKAVLKGSARRAVARVTAADISDLLRRRPLLGTEPLTEKDVAVLTRSNDQCFLVQDALRERGVHSVVIGDKSVFSAEEAADLELVLGAVLEPGRSSSLRSALASSLVGATGEEIARMDAEPLGFQAWATRFRRWNAIWVERGFMRMFRALLDEARCAERLLGSPGGERRLTNVLHLAELLHRASSEEHLGPAALLRWLAEQRVGAPVRAEHAEIRLESDEHAVRILTVHRAKGLEFKVVYCPYLWDSVVPTNNGTLRPFHDADGNVLVDIDHDRNRRQKNFELAAREAFADELRVAYVALTRAQHRTTVVFGGFSSAGASAAAYLLVPPADSPTNKLPEKGRLDKLGDRELEARLGELASGCASVGLRSVPWRFDAPALERALTPSTALAAKTVERPIRAWSRTDSFSALIRHEREVPADDPEGIDHDEESVDAAPADVLPRFVERERIALDRFPRGRVAGDFFHSILETIDFSSVKNAELLDAGTEKLETYGFLAGVEPLEGDRLRAQVVAALRDTLETELAPAGAFRLRDITLARRFSELEFHVPVRPSAASAGGLSAKTLAAVFRDHPSPALPPGYAERVERLGFAPLSGFLRGFIDLVFEHQGLWYVVDYKTNHLGDFVDEYDAARMGAEMAESHYFLQYHLYTLAVARFLRRHGPELDYERAFGGVLYLFIKGMRPGRTTGIFFEKPPIARLRALSAALGAEPW